MKLASKIVLALGAIVALALVGALIFAGFAMINWNTMIDGDVIGWILNTAGYGEYADQIDNAEVQAAISAISYRQVATVTPTEQMNATTKLMISIAGLK